MARQPAAEVWASDCLIAVKHLKYIQYKEPYPKISLEWVNRINWGRPLEPADVPQFAWLESGHRHRHVGDFCLMNGRMPLISPRFAELLRRFDLGAPEDLGPIQSPGHRRVELHPMPLYDEDRKNLIGDFVFMHVATERSLFVPEGATGVQQTGHLYYPITLRTLTAPVRRPEPGPTPGPDLWRDPILTSVIFFSGCLHDAILAAGITDITFRPCPIAD